MHVKTTISLHLNKTDESDDRPSAAEPQVQREGLKCQCAETAEDAQLLRHSRRHWKCAGQSVLSVLKSAVSVQRPGYQKLVPELMDLTVCSSCITWSNLPHFFIKQNQKKWHLKSLFLLFEKNLQMISIFMDSNN